MGIWGLEICCLKGSFDGNLVYPKPYLVDEEFESIKVFGSEMSGELDIAPEEAVRSERNEDSWR